MNSKYNALKNTTDWIINSSSEEFMSTFKNLNDNYSGITIGEFTDSFIEQSESNCIEYDIITTENFIFGLDEFITDEKYEWKNIISPEKAYLGNVELVDPRNIKLIDSAQGCTDLYDAANDSLYYYSLAA